MTATDTGAPPTGRDLLGQTLKQRDLARRGQDIWALLETARPSTCAHINQHVLPVLNPTRALDARARVNTSWEVFEALKRGLSRAPHTLRAIAAGTPSPVHGDERGPLVSGVRHKLTAHGYPLETAAAKALVYQLVGVVAATLDRPVHPVPRVPRAPFGDPVTNETVTQAA